MCSIIGDDVILSTAVAHCSSAPVTIRAPPTPEVGYISGVYPATTSGQCRSSMYELRAARGQRWNISLLDFAIAHAPAADTGTGNGNGAAASDGNERGWKSSVGSVCRRLAVVRENLSTMGTKSSDEMTVCGGGSDRERTVFLSQTEIIRVELQAQLDAEDQSDRFLLQFAGQLSPKLSSSILLFAVRLLLADLFPTTSIPFLARLNVSFTNFTQFKS